MDHYGYFNTTEQVSTINKHKGSAMTASCTAGLSHVTALFVNSAIHHKAEGSVTRRHTVKTDVWLSCTSRRVLSRRLLNMNAAVGFQSGHSRSSKTLAANGYVADCLHLVGRVREQVRRVRSCPLDRPVQVVLETSKSQQPSLTRSSSPLWWVHEDEGMCAS